jgi:hypothetical protein
VEQTIPAGHYFVAGEEKGESAAGVSVSRSWALTGAENLERLR